MRDLDVGNLIAVLVFARHEVPNHVVLVLFRASVSASFDDFHVCLRHFVLGVITLPVMGKRCPGKHEVYGGEAHVEVVVEIGKAGIEFTTDFFAL